MAEAERALHRLSHRQALFGAGYHDIGAFGLIEGRPSRDTIRSLGDRQLLDEVDTVAGTAKNVFGVEFDPDCYLSFAGDTPRQWT